MQYRIWIVLVFSSLAAFFFSGCQTNPLTGGWSGFYSMDQDDSEVFKRIALTFRNEYTFSGHTNYQIRVQNLTERKMKVMLSRITTRRSKDEEYTIRDSGRYKRFEFVIEPGGYAYSEVFRLEDPYVQSMGFDKIEVIYVAE